MVTDAMVEAAWRVIRSCGTPVGAADGDTYIPRPPTREDVKRALEAAEKVAPKAVPDWYWRHFDPDDAGDSIHETLRNVGEGVVCHIGSSYVGPSFYAAMVPVLDLESDDTEEITADTEEECLSIVKEHMRLYSTLRSTPPEASHD